VVFLATMAATNFSAFTVFGASGAGYRDGFAFFPIVGFGTGFMALTFWVIGRRAREVSHRYGALTPPELVRVTYGNRFLSTLFALVLIVYTIPYLALQPMAAGYALKELFGWDQAVGAGVVTLIICFYTFRGGLKAVAWTDVFQGLIMLSVMIIAVIVVADKHGGLGQAGATLMAAKPELFSRPGGQGTLTVSIWFSYIFLWFFCDPMFPQLFQRFMAARDDRTIRTTMLAYPLVCSLVFLLPVTIGVLGHLSHPDLQGQAADRILPLLAADMNSSLLGALVIACGLAALMSTMDSQLLTLSSIFSLDVYPLLSKRQAGSAWPGRLFVFVLAFVGYLLAINPPGTILTIAQQAFTGLAVLFPTVLFGLYPGWRSSWAASVSILSGQAALLLNLAGLLPTAGFLPVVPIMLVSFIAYLLTSAGQKLALGGTFFWPGTFFESPYTWSFGVILVLAHDWWRWGATTSLVFGIPAWVYYFLMLSLAQTLVMARWTGSGRFSAEVHPGANLRIGTSGGPAVGVVGDLAETSSAGAGLLRPDSSSGARG
jgi:SSS family solute:Na+ symporter